MLYNIYSIPQIYFKTKTYLKYRTRPFAKYLIDDK